MEEFLAWVEDHEVLVSSATSLFTTILAFALGGLVGVLLTARLSIRAKEREGDLTAVQRVRALYGQYLSTKRLWDIHVRNQPLSKLDDRGLQLLDRACAAEGEIEAILMKIASERKLDDIEIDEIGLVRQGYQKLREHITNLKPLDWGYSNHPQYMALKSGTHVIMELLSDRQKQHAPPDQFKRITENKYEGRWEQLGHNARPDAPLTSGELSIV